MPYDIDIGGAPAEEACAQLSHTPDYDCVNKFEVQAYKLAIIACFGSPPDGCRLTQLYNRHDFGLYRTLGLRVDNERCPEVAAYAEIVENGLGRWTDAAFAPPVTYAGSVATISRPDHDECVIGALQATRPNADGKFPLDAFATIHGNLTAAFPELAEVYRKRMCADA